MDKEPPVNSEAPRAFLLSRQEAIELRNTHLSQFMAINGQAVFVVLAAVFGVLVGLDSVEKILADERAFHVAVTAVGVAVLLLVIAGVSLSHFHTGAIRRLQESLRNDSADIWVRREHLAVIPESSWRNTFILIGLLILVVTTLVAFFYVAHNGNPGQ
jgi:hypothetical protein